MTPQQYTRSFTKNYKPIELGALSVNLLFQTSRHRSCTAGGFSSHHHLSYPKGTSVNDIIAASLASVSYSTFDDATSKLLTLGPGTLLAKTDIDSAFRLIPIHPDDHCLLGFRFKDLFYFDTCPTKQEKTESAALSLLSWVGNWTL